MVLKVLSKWLGRTLVALSMVLATVMPVSAGEKFTVVAFGDSLTQGYGLAKADGFVPQLQDWLQKNGAPDVKILNAGVSGDTTAGGLARIDWTLGGGPVDAVIVLLGGNDLLRGLAPEQTRANLDAILAAIDARALPVLLAGLPAPANYGPQFQQEFATLFPALAQKYATLFYPDFLAAVAQPDGTPDIKLLQDDATHPNPEGVRAIVNDIGPLVLEMVQSAR